MSSPAIKTFSILRMFVGTTSLLFPRQFGPVFGVSISPEGTIIARLLGIREFVVGAYLWKANQDRNAYLAKDTRVRKAETNGTAQERLLNSKPSEIATGRANNGVAASGRGLNVGLDDTQTIDSVLRDKLNAALWLNVIIDCVDVFSSIACMLEGTMSDLAKVSFGGGAVLFAAIGIAQLRILGREEE